VQQIRYKPYGEIRYVSGTSFNARAFTGYEHDETSTLDFAGARWYDAAVGMFLTHDPARQFASPYTYTNWDPVNRTDPNGAIVPLIVIGIALAIAGVVAAGIDAGVRSGEPAVGLKAAGLAAASTVAGPLNGGLQLVAPKEFGHFHARDWAIAQIPVAGSAYGAARNFETGNYASGTVGVARSVYEAYGVYDNGSWSTPGEAATSVAKAATAPFIGDNFGEAWRNAVADTLAGNWTRGPTGGYMPASWAAALATVQYPDGAKANGMHAWHAGSNALFARSLGILGAPLLLAGGVLHESPLDWASFQAEQYWQGSVNHFLDSATDIAANVFGMGVGSSKLSGTSAALSTLAAEWGNYIPGPGEPDPAFGGGGPYKGNPTDAWGQYP